MGRSEVELVRQMCEAFSRGDWAAAAAPLHDDIEWDTTTMGLWPEAAVLRGKGSGKASGAEVERRFAQLWTVLDGKVVRFRAYADREAALRAAEGGETG
jgi:ketosteroid isomerase-like protein